MYMYPIIWEENNMKLGKKIVVILALIVFTFSLTACGNKNAGTLKTKSAPKAPTIVGEWKVDLDSLNKLIGVDAKEFDDVNYLIEDLAVKVEFTEDGKVITKVTSQGNTVVLEQADTYTATFDENNYRLSINGNDPYYFTLNGNQLVIVGHTIPEN